MIRTAPRTLAASTQPIPGGLMATEPAKTIGSAISGVLIAIFYLLKVLGVEYAADLPNAATLLVTALLAIPAVTGWITKHFVYSPATAQVIANDAAVTGEAASTNPPPATKDAGVPVDTDPRYDPNDPAEVPPAEWATNRQVRRPLMPPKPPAAG